MLASSKLFALIVLGCNSSRVFIDVGLEWAIYISVVIFVSALSLVFGVAILLESIDNVFL